MVLPSQPNGSSARLRFCWLMKGHTQGLEDLAIEMLARGLSVRDIEDASRMRTADCCCRRRRYRSLGSGCGRITRPSPSAI